MLKDFNFNFNDKNSTRNSQSFQPNKFGNAAAQQQQLAEPSQPNFERTLTLQHSDLNSKPSKSATRVSHALYFNFNSPAQVQTHLRIHSSLNVSVFNDQDAVTTSQLNSAQYVFYQPADAICLQRLVDMIMLLYYNMQSVMSVEAAALSAQALLFFFKSIGSSLLSMTNGSLVNTVSMNVMWMLIWCVMTVPFVSAQGSYYSSSYGSSSSGSSSETIVIVVLVVIGLCVALCVCGRGRRACMECCVKDFYLGKPPAPHLQHLLNNPVNVVNPQSSLERNLTPTAFLQLPPSSWRGKYEENGNWYNWKPNLRIVADGSLNGSGCDKGDMRNQLFQIKGKWFGSSQQVTFIKTYYKEQTCSTLQVDHEIFYRGRVNVCFNTSAAVDSADSQLLQQQLVMSGRWEVIDRPWHDGQFVLAANIPSNIIRQMQIENNLMQSVAASAASVQPSAPSAPSGVPLVSASPMAAASSAIQSEGLLPSEWTVSKAYKSFPVQLQSVALHTASESDQLPDTPPPPYTYKQTTNENARTSATVGNDVV